MQSAFHPDWGQNANYTLEALPGSPDGEVRATIAKMIGYITTDAKSPFIQAEARRMVELGDGDPNLGLWRLLKPHMTFKRDEAIADDLQSSDPRIADTIEVIIRPIDQWLLIKMRGMGIGDCDCFHCYGACLLIAAGVPCSFVTVDADPEAPGIFSHVYLASYLNGQRTALDLSHGPEIGWECPNLGRLKEWPVNWTQKEHWLSSLFVVGGLAAAYFGLKWATR